MVNAEESCSFGDKLRVATAPPVVAAADDEEEG